MATDEAPRESRAASLYGLSTGTIASTPAIAEIGFSRRSVSGPMTPMITRDAPRLICASRPNSRTRVTIRWICSSVAFGCVMIIILFQRDHQNEAATNFLQAQILRFQKEVWFVLCACLIPRQSHLALRKGEVRRAFLEALHIGVRNLPP